MGFFGGIILTKRLDLQVWSMMQNVLVSLSVPIIILRKKLPESSQDIKLAKYATRDYPSRIGEINNFLEILR